VSDQTDKQAQDFLSLFGGDISAARMALDSYDQSRRAPKKEYSNPSYKQQEVIISIRNVSKTYKLTKQSVTALHDINLDIYKGELIAITGTSGSGKSTLLQIIGCLDKPTNGKVIIEGKDATKLSDPRLSELRKNTMGFIFQSFYLQPFLRLNDNVSVPAMFTKTKKRSIDEKVESLLRQMGISDRADHYPKELSGGQIQRAAIARALVNSPSVILADEPTGNLDSKNSQAIIDLFKKIRNELGTTIIIVTHDPHIAQQVDRTVELKDGVIL
jgi:ABC-type lipoprotein export system ATPase subunit